MVDLSLAVGAHGWDQVENEERRPQYHEREEHYSKHFGGLLLEPDDPTVARAVAGHHAARPRVVAAYRRLVSVRTRRG